MKATIDPTGRILVLTRLPGDPRVGAEDAVRLIDGSFPKILTLAPGSLPACALDWPARASSAVPHLADITADDIDDWYAMLLPAAPTRRAHAYSLLSTIMRSASTGRRPLIPDSPCKVEHPTVLHRTFEPKPATPQQIATIVENMPDKYQALILLAAWCGLRRGEVSELRRKDLDLASMSVRVERAVVWRKGEATVGTPKSRAGVRTIALPPNLRPALKRHLAEHAMPGPDGLLFPNATKTGHLHVNTLSKTYHRARQVAGRPDLRFHDLRHSAATMAAQAGPLSRS
jgi:integrase